MTFVSPGPGTVLVNPNMPITMIDDEPNSYKWFEERGWEVIQAPDSCYFKDSKSELTQT